MEGEIRSKEGTHGEGQLAAISATHGVPVDVTLHSYAQSVLDAIDLLPLGTPAAAARLRLSLSLFYPWCLVCGILLVWYFLS